MHKRVADTMMKHDGFSRWCGMQVEESRPGYCRITIPVTDVLCNGFEVAHGGVLFAVCDSALAFASNEHGQHALTTDAHVQYLQPAKAGDSLTAIATEVHRSRKLGRYRVELTNQNNELLCVVTATVYIKETQWNQP